MDQKENDIPEREKDFVFNSPPKTRRETEQCSSSQSNVLPAVLRVTSPLTERERRKREIQKLRIERDRRRKIRKIRKPGGGVWINNEATAKALKELDYNPKPKWQYPHDPLRPPTPEEYWNPGWWSPKKAKSNEESFIESQDKAKDVQCDVNKD